MCMKHSTASLLGFFSGAILSVIFLYLMQIPINIGFSIGYLTGGVVSYFFLRKYLNE